MLSLWESGIERVLAGSTSLHELLDNVAAPITDSDSKQSDVDSLLAQLLGGGGAPAAAAAHVGSVPAPAPAARIPSAPPAPAVAGSRVPAPVPCPSGGGPRVLLVDEDREARRALRAELEREGIRVIEAADGEAGLAYARRLRPDYVITEIVLPRLDGIGLMQALFEEGQTCPVFVCTRQTDGALLEWARELGALEVLTAPVEAKALVSRMAGARQTAA